MRFRPLVVFALLLFPVCFAQIQDVDREAADAAFTSSKWDEAITNYRKVLARNPNDARSWFRLGHAYHEEKDYKEAIQAFRRTVNLQYLRLTSQFNIACAYVRLNDLEQGFIELEKAIDMGFNSTQQILQDIDLIAIRGTPKFDRLVERARNPVLEFPAGRRMQLPTGRWSVQGGRAGTMTTNATSRGFAHQIDMVVEGRRAFNVVLMFSAASGEWSGAGADRDGGLYSGQATIQERSVRISGKRGDQGETRLTLELLDADRATVTIQDHVGSEWRVRQRYEVTLQSDGGR